jgi:nucleosome-remodeling factor subunit BPTF
MSTRGSKRRGRPPKSVVMERPKKFQMHLLKKPKYLMNRESKGSETPNSQSSTPSASRASSPAISDVGRRASSRYRARGRSRSNRRGAGSSYQRRGYNPDAVDERDSEYHYGSDFGEDSNSNKSDLEEEIFHESDSNDENDTFTEVDNSSDSEFSLTRYSPVSGGSTPRRAQRPSPIPLWLQEREIPPLDLPPSSDDLLVPRSLAMKALGIYEVIRHFGNLARLSPFRFEDLCACLVSEEQSALLAEVHVSLLKALLREEDAQQTHYGPLDQRDSVNILLYCVDTMTWPEALRSYVESDKEFSSRARVLSILQQHEYPFVSVEDRLEILQFLTDQFLTTNPVREELLSEGKYGHYANVAQLLFAM